MMETTPRRQLVDVSTGEVHEIPDGYQAVLVPRGRKASYGRNWTAMQNSAAADIARDRRITDFDRTVLWALVGDLDFDNWVRPDVTGLADEMGRSREAVSRTLTRLVLHGYLQSGPKLGRSRTFRLSSDVGYRGPAKDAHRPERRGLRSV